MASKPKLPWLILLISFPSVATVFLTPALPAISDFFHVSNGYAQQLITFYVLGYALGPLLYSPFANRYGRKTAIWYGLGLYLFSCIVCLLGIYFHNLNLIILGRFLMALGASVGIIVSFTMIHDTYSPSQARTMVSYTVIAYSFMPALGVTLGGFLASKLTWIDCFYSYLIYGLLMLIVAKQLPETLKQKDYQALKFKPLYTSYRNAFLNKRVVLFSTMYGIMSGFIYVIATGAPFIGIDEIGLSPEHYGTLLLIPYLGQFIGGLLSGRLHKLFRLYTVMLIGIAITFLGCLIILICFLGHWINSATLILSLFFIMMGLPITYSCNVVMSAAEYPDKATASAILSSIAMFIALLSSVIYSLLPNHQPLMLPLCFMGLILLMGMLFYYAKNNYSDKNLS